MISISSPKILENLYASAHPGWTGDAVHAAISDFLCGCDPRLEKTVETYASFGVESDYAHGEFSLSLIRALRRGCSFIDAVMLMSEYLHDPQKGKALILRK